MENKTSEFKLDSIEARKGAKACLEGMGEVEMISDRYLGSCATHEQHFQMVVDSQQAMISNAEPDLSPFMAGYLAAIGEYICFNVLIGKPWLDNGWTPWAAMTKKKEEADKKKIRAG